MSAYGDGWENRPRWVGYVVTVLAEVAMSAFLMALEPVFPLGHYPVPYIVLTMLIAYTFGEGPAILSVLLGFIAFVYLFVSPHHVFWPIATEVEGWARVVAFFLGVSIVAAAAVQARRSQRRIQRLADEASRLNVSLREEIEERKRAEEEVRTLNAELDRRVAERTTELEASNRELEAFSYSVSHDLRAPLRAIDGFSNAVLKHYPESLDARGQDYLRRIRAAAQRMAQLIDDVLGLSRASRAEMHRQRVDLSAMALEILGDLRRSQPQRKAEISVERGLIANADAHLLRIVLDNLLDNAWKFTGRRDVARIELGVTEQDGERVYYIRDNGAGFNPAYADKLFSPFQRLHAEDEFPGTGIGLALVQRILRRHGGRIWAESAVEQGATFHFTLGEARE